MDDQQYMINWAAALHSAESSFARNELGWIIYGLIRAYRPNRCVEFGILHGYSTLFIGGALRDNGRGFLDAFDRWPGHLPNLRNEVLDKIKDSGLNDIINVETRDVLANPPGFPGPIDFLMVDLNNTAETFFWVMKNYANHMSQNGIMVFEGGSRERDKEVWIDDNNLTPIRQALNNRRLWQDWKYFVVEPWPSLTIVKRRDA